MRWRFGKSKPLESLQKQVNVDDEDYDQIISDIDGKLAERQTESDVLVDESNPCISELNKKQRSAVLSESKRLLVLAGAGSGKTKTFGT